MASVSTSLTIDTSQFEAALKRAEQQVNAFANSFQQTTNKIQNSFNGLNSSLSSVTSGFKALIAAIGVQEIANFADTVTNAKNRLNQLTSSQEETNNQFKAMAAIAVTTRNSVSNVTDLYFRLARSADQVGISQKEAAQITESIAKSITASGISAKEAAGPLLQLGQAFASGKFQGDELRSILEGLPPVANALAKHFDVPVGALKELGSQGKITALDFADAMKAAAGSIDAAFAKTTPTISQSMTQLKTALALAYDNFENNTKAGKSFAAAIEYLGFVIFKASQNIDKIIGPLWEITKVLGAIVAANAVIKMFTMIGGAITYMGAAAVTARAALVGMGAAMTALASGSMAKFVTTVVTTATPLGRLAKALVVVGSAAAAYIGFNKAEETFSGMAEGSSDAADELKKYYEELNKFKEGLSDEKGKPQFDTTALEKQLTLAKKENDESIRKIQLTTSLIGKSEEYRQMQSALFDSEEKRLAAVTALQEQYGKSKNPDVLNFMAQSINRVNAQYDAQAAAIKKAMQAQLDATRADQLRIFGLKELEAANQKILDLQFQIAKVGLPEIEQRYLDIEAAAIKSAEAAIAAEEARRGSAMSDKERQAYLDAAVAKTSELKDKTLELAEAEARREKTLASSRERLEIEKQIRDIQSEMATMTMSEIEKKEHDIKRAAEERARAYIAAEEARTGVKISSADQQAIIDEYIAGTKDLVDATKKSYDMSRTFATGWKQAMNDYVKQAGDGAAKAKSIFAKAMSGMEDLLVNFAKTGKFEWKNFVAMMLEELLRAQIQVIFAQMLGDMSGAMKGSAGGGGALGGLLGSGQGGQSASGGLLGSIGKLFGLGGDSKSGGGSGGSSGGILSSVGDWIGGLFTADKYGTDVGSDQTKILQQQDAAFGGFWDSMSEGASGWWDSATSTLGDWGSSIGDWGSSIGSSIGDWGSSAGSWAGDALSSVGDFFGGFFADGGNLGAGKWGIAGEAGPEIISGPATITPMSDLSTGGGSTNVTYNINAVDAMSFKQLLAQDPSYLYGLTMMGASGVSRRR